MTRCGTMKAMAENHEEELVPEELLKEDYENVFTHWREEYLDDWLPEYYYDNEDY